MPTNRFGYSDDFVLNNGKVGINSATPQEKLDVVGVVKGDALKVTGVSSFTTYEGFLNSNQNITESISLEAGQGITGSLSGEIIVGTGITVTGIGSAISGQGYIESLKVYNTFTVPVGGTTDRPSKAKPGQLFFNRDFGTMEFWDGDRWRQVDNTTQRGRGVFGSGTGNSQLIEYVNISTQGNSINFGTLTVSHDTQPGSCASSIRGIFAGGSPVTNVIDYITIASEGNAIDFGDLTVARLYFSGSSSSTRGIFAGGFTPTPTNTYLNIIDYVTIASIGNALDFGDLIATRLGNASCSSPTRSVIFSAEANVLNTIQFVTIASTGNAIRFGELNVTKTTYNGSFSSSTRGVSCGGYSTIPINVIEYVTIATTGNAIYFGDLTGSNRFATAGASSNTRGLCGGGGNPGSSVNIIDFVTIANTGNAQDFGDLVASRGYLTALSDSHGGLGGF